MLFFVCGFWAGGIIGSFFFENAADQTIKVNGARYHDDNPVFCFAKLQNMDVKMWFRQDTATCNSRNNSITKSSWSYNVSYFGDQNWLLRLCDLMLLNFFLWSF